MKNTSAPVKIILSPDRRHRCLAAALLAAVFTLGACDRSNGARPGDLVLSGNIEVSYSLPRLRLNIEPFASGEDPICARAVCPPTPNRQDVAIRQALLNTYFNHPLREQTK